MLKRLVEDFDGDSSSEYESKQKKRKTQPKQEYLLFNSSSSPTTILDSILNFMDAPTTQLNFLSTCKQLYQLKNCLPKQNNYLHNIHQHYSSVINKKEGKLGREHLYRLDGFLRNLYIRNEWIEVLGFYYEGSRPKIDDEEEDEDEKEEDDDDEDDEKEEVGEGKEYFGRFSSSIHVKFQTYSDEPIILHQNLDLFDGVGHYYLARELDDSSLQTLVEITHERVFDIPAFESLLFSIKGNIQMEVLFKIMLGIGGIACLDHYLKFILNTYNYIKDLPPIPEVVKKVGKKKRISYFGEQRYSDEVDTKKCREYPFSHQLDSLIEILKYGDDFKHTESMTTYVMELIYKSMASFSSNQEIDPKYCIAAIEKQFVSGKCFLNKDDEYTFIVTLKKANGNMFKILIMTEEQDFEDDEDDEEEIYPYEPFEIMMLDPSGNKFLREKYSNHERVVQNKLKELIPGIEDLSFEGLCACIVSLVFSRGYLVNYKHPGKPIWKNLDQVLPKRTRKTLSAPIEAGQIGDDGLDLDPLTIFWMGSDLSVDYDYGDVKTIKNPKIKDEVFEYVSNLIAKFRAIKREDIEYKTYKAKRDAHALYPDGIADVHDFDYQEKSLYYVYGRYNYSVMVCGFKDVVICGKAADEIFYWTPYCYFRTGEGEEEEEEEKEDTTYDVSHLKPLKKLKKEVTFDKVLDNIEEFFAQFK